MQPLSVAFEQKSLKSFFCQPFLNYQAVSSFNNYMIICMINVNEIFLSGIIKKFFSYVVAESLVDEYVSNRFISLKKLKI